MKFENSGGQEIAEGREPIILQNTGEHPMLYNKKKDLEARPLDLLPFDTFP